jgi:hypothetical protein
MTTTTNFPNVSLDGLTLLFRVEGGPVDLDSQGVEWLLTKLEGWVGKPAPRVVRTDRPGHAGSFRSAAYTGSRIMTLEFIATAPDISTIRAAETQVATICSDPAQLYPMVVTENGGSRQVMVELDDAIVSAPRLWNSTIFSVRVAAPDPRKHDVAWQSPIGNLGTPPTGGLDFTAPGAVLTSPGADFGTPGQPSAMTVHNAGTATARPFVVVSGPLAAGWQLADINSGAVLTFTKALAATDTLTINTDEFPAQGFPGRSAYLNVQNNQRPALLVPNGWPRVLPGTTATYNLRSPTYTSASVTVSLRSAWN